MQLFEDDEDEESIPRKAFEEGFYGSNPKPQEKDELEEASNYIENLGDNEDEITEKDLSKKEQQIVNEIFKDDEL